MLSDPRIGKIVSLLVVASAVGWFVALEVAADALYARLDMSMHAITFLAIFLVLAGLATAALFSRYATVRSDLLAGRDVVAAWTVDRACKAAAMPAVLDEDRRDKRQVLLLIWGFVVVVFGAFALVDPEAAPGMIAVAVVVMAATGVAFLSSGRIARRQAEFRGGAVIVGRRGLLFDGVLHVWSLPIGRLMGAVYDEPAGLFRLAYGWITRAGWQTVTVAIPVPPAAAEIARHGAVLLDEAGGRRTAKPRSRRRG